MANTLGDMIVRIVGDTAGFNKSLTDTQKKMAAFGINALAIGAAVAKAAKIIADETKKFIEYGSAIYDASQKTGLSTDAIQEWKFIAEQSGTTLETVTSSVALMTRGLKNNAQEFKNLGVETKNADGSFRSTTDIFNDTITALSQMTNETERDQMAFKLLGRGAQAMIPILNAGASGLESMKNEARSLGLVIATDAISNADKLGDSLDALKAAGNAYSATLVNQMSPALITLTNGLKNIVISANDSANAFINANAVMAGTATLEQIRSLIREKQRLIAVNQENEGLASVDIALNKEIKGLYEQLATANRNLGFAAEKRAKDQIKAEENAKAMELAIIKQKLEEKQEAIDKANEKEIEKENEKREAIIKSNQELYDEEYLQRQLDLQYRIDAYNADVLANQVANDAKRASYMEFAGSVTSVGKAVFDQLGKDIVDGTVSWNNLATAAVNAIGNIVSALGDQMAAKAAAAFIDAIILGLLGAGSLAAQSAGAGAAYAAAAAAAWTAGAALKAKKFAMGGVVQPQPGGVQAVVAEAGQAEAIIPLDRLDQMLARAGGSTGKSGVVLHIGTLIASPDSYRELNRMLGKYSSVEKVRR